MRNRSYTRIHRRKFWLNAGLSLSVAGLPWTAAVSLFGSSTIAALMAPPVQAAMLSSWEFDSSTQELTISVPSGTEPRYFLAAEPARIVLDLPNTEVGTVPLQQTYGGAIREIRVAQFEPGVTRIVLELAPGTVLAPGHVELRQEGETASVEQPDRWVLRPLLATGAAVAAVPHSSADGFTSPSTLPAPIAPDLTSNLTPNSPSDLTPNLTEAELPPLEPGATEIPVELPSPELSALPMPEVAETQSEIARVETDLPETVRMPGPSIEENTQSTAIVDRPAPQEPAPQEPDREVNSEVNSGMNSEMNSEVNSEMESPSNLSPETVATLPTLPDASPNALPPATNHSTGTVSVPPLDPEPSLDSELLDSERMETPPTPPSFPPPSQSQAAPALSVPPSVPTPEPIATAPIEFGQPLPKSAANSLPSGNLPSGNLPSGAIDNANGGNILLAAGTALHVRYTGEEPLELSSESPRQEVLVLAEAVRDGAGNVVFPEGSYVIGRFESGEAGSRFIAQAISWQGQSIAVSAESAPLSGDRPASQGNLLRNSALGLAAGVLLGVTGIGLIPAIAAGAATTAGITFLPNAQPNVIQPDQVLEMHLMQDLSQLN